MYTKNYTHLFTRQILNEESEVGDGNRSHTSISLSKYLIPLKQIHRVSTF